MKVHSGPEAEPFRQLAAQYAQSIDRGQADRLAALFVDDAVIEGPDFHLQGIAAIRGIPARLQEYFEGTRHLVLQQCVEIDGAIATGETYGEAHHRLRQERPQILVWHLRYRDRFLREHGQWRFQHRQVLIDWVETRDLAMPEIRGGSR